MSSLQELLKGREIYSIHSDASIKETVGYMAEKGVGILPVMKEDKLVGVFSERDLVKRIIAKDKDLYLTKVQEVMSTDLVVAKIDESHEAALAKMKEAKTRHILVIDGDKLAGVLSIRDLLEVDLLSCKTTVEVLNNYIYSK
jgi:CBS domain-containing protein